MLVFHVSSQQCTRELTQATVPNVGVIPGSLRRTLLLSARATTTNDGKTEVKGKANNDEEDSGNERKKRRESSVSQAASHDAEIAITNPHLNLVTALGTGNVNTTEPGTFSVKRRWDHKSVSPDLIFKKQAMDTRDKPRVNDHLRTQEIHGKGYQSLVVEILESTRH
ncbi:hypothetical protein ARMSODRAFT_973662 [Armillaria solidipes]|uniref:Uncharacterized protein n=1 Tax=Armillaria solidipes TaxID=1076256 RepID=A0A2H3BK09_9AGAR|nr:hypothetical protein ARMSODRAFT_973662 [Armillaria solidipes]